ncbi:hypothetical protein FCOIX_2316 [Fusarium coicis]|nr:hypothetical protein FCOIX_2316 [Fusarium coicis]
MRFSCLLPALMASAEASALPDTDESFLDHLDDGTVHVFKRDATISSRDIELAKRDGVDPNQMYCHSMIKRDDGDHVTIWVDNSYDESEPSEPDIDDSDAWLAKRQKHRVVNNSWKTVGKSKWCRLSRATYVGNTGPGAPTTGGPNAVINWSKSCKGNWRVDNRSQRDLVVAGSNGGANMRFKFAGKRDIALNVDGRIGCKDVGILTETSRDRFQKQFSGKWRVSARGDVNCEAGSSACGSKGVCFPTAGSQTIYWWLDNYGGSV